MLRGFLGGEKEGDAAKKSGEGASSRAGGADGGKNSGGGKGSDDPAQAAKQEDEAKRETRLQEEPSIQTPEAEQGRHRSRYLAKLRESAVGADSAESMMRRAGGGGGISYEGMMRPASRVMPLDPTSGVDFHEGLVLSSNRMVQNLQIGSKWSLGAPQQSSWEFTLGTHGFSDNTSVSYTTGGRWALMHQRVFRNGSFGMLQFICNPPGMGGGMMPPNTMVAMLIYPWSPHGGTSQFQYVMGQQCQVSHASRVVRGLDVGAQLTYDVNTNGTSVTYGFHSQSADKSRNWCGSYTPETGAWKLALTKMDWQSDIECGAQMELADKRGQLVPAFSLGLRKPLFGGGVVHAMLVNFHRLKAFVELPFGGERQGMNQVTFKWLVQYDAAIGGAKHGVTIGF